jgi:hypothetical protein
LGEHQPCKLGVIGSIPIASTNPSDIALTPNVKSKVKGSSASGLMQVTDQMRRILSGGPDNKGYREVTSNKIRISKEEIFDPLLNVAIGTRCLFYKYSKIPGSADKNIFNAIKNYHSWNESGEDYAKKATDLFKKSK